MRTLGQFREFTKDLPDDCELRVESYFAPNVTKTSPVFDYISAKNDNCVVIMPEAVYISDGSEEMAVTHKPDRK